MTAGTQATTWLVVVALEYFPGGKTGGLITFLKHGLLSAAPGKVCSGGGELRGIEARVRALPCLAQRNPAQLCAETSPEK